MKYSRLWVAAAIIAFVVIVGFVLSVPHTTRDAEKISSLQNAATVVPGVSLHDSYKKGLHTITGSVKAPNACTTVAAQATLSGDAADPSGILVQITLPTDTGVCLQVPTNASFSTTISAPTGLPITATVNGEAATTTVS